MAILIQTALVITVLCASFLGVFVYTKKRFSLQHILLAILFFSIGAWALSTLMVLQQESLLGVKFAFASAVVLAVSKFYFIINFPERNTQSKLLTYVPLGLAILFFIFSFSDQAYFTSFTVVNEYYVLIENGPYADMYMLFISVILIYPIVNLYLKMRSSKYINPFADQIKFLFIGTTFFFLLGLTTNSILPVVFNIHQLNGIGPSLSLVLAGFILYIINKYHFLNLSLIIQRGFIYSVLVTVIVAVYLGILFILQTVYQQPSLISPILSGLLTSIFGIFSVPHIDAYLRKKTDKFFFKDGYDYSNALQHISEVLNPSLEISKIKIRISEFLEQTLKASAVDFNLQTDPDNRKQVVTELTSTDIGTIVVPLTSNEKYIGDLLVCSKRSGEPYTPQDLQLLKTLSYHLGMAFERALLHKELQDYSRHLEQKVKERTAALNNAYDSQRVMISNIAHGLQTPLTIIEGEMDNLTTYNSSSNQLLPLRHSLSSISNFITDLLRLAHLEAETDSMDFETCDLGLLVQEIVSYVAVLAADKGVSLKYSGLSGLLICGDPKRIEEALLAIISNALKYTQPEKSAEVFIRVEGDERNAVVTVTDTGIGISQESISKLFDRFYREKNNRTADIQGSGLGLSIAQAIILKHGGVVSVESELGVGTTFTVQIPRIIIE